MTVGLIGIGGTNWSLVDGSPLAPSGTAQHPTLLNGYLKRPPWKVAGVDYAVGIDRSLYPTNANLSDPAPSGTVAAALAAQGCTYASRVLTIPNGATVVIDGYDFSLHTGVHIFGGGSTADVTISNCLFAYSASLAHGVIEFDGRTIVLKNLDIDGTNIDVSTFVELIGPGISGSLTVKYCWIRNSGSDMFSLAPSNVPVTIQFNLLENIGGAVGAHPDFLQSASGTFNPLLLMFNTCVENNPAQANVAAQGFYVANSQVMNGANLYGNNTLVGTVNNNEWFSGITQSAVLNGTMQINTNYCDETGMNFARASDRIGGTNTLIGGITLSGNINMVSGASLDITN